MSKAKNNKEKILQTVTKKHILRVRSLRESSARTQLSRLVKVGKIQRLSRGVYALPDADFSEFQSLAITCLTLPNAVVCLISALHFHDLTTQIPKEIWLAIKTNSRTPRFNQFPVRFLWYSPKALSTGVTTVMIDGVPVKIFNPAKTIVDCFRYRHKIGMDVCLEALREGWRKRLFSMDELWKYAKICRVSTVIRPYLEALV